MRQGPTGWCKGAGEGEMMSPGELKKEMGEQDERGLKGPVRGTLGE